jgi:hypothetical protein
MPTIEETPELVDSRTFELIERHKKAWALMQAAEEIYNRTIDESTPCASTAEDALAAADRVVTAAWQDLLAATPTTVKSMAALVVYIAGHECLGEDGDSREMRALEAIGARSLARV